MATEKQADYALSLVSQRWAGAVEGARLNAHVALSDLGHVEAVTAEGLDEALAARVAALRPDRARLLAMDGTAVSCLIDGLKRGRPLDVLGALAWGGSWHANIPLERKCVAFAALFPGLVEA